MAVSERLARAVLQDIRRSVKHEHGLASVAPLHGGARRALSEGLAEQSLGLLTMTQ